MVKILSILLLAASCYGQAFTFKDAAFVGNLAPKPAGGGGGIATGLVAYWKFEAATGVSQADSTGGGHDLLAHNAPTQETIQTKGGSFSAGMGGSKYYENLDAAFQGAGSFSMASWFYLSAAPSGLTLWSRWGVSANVWVLLDNGSGSWEMIARKNDNSNNELPAVSTVGTTINDGFHLICFGYSASANQVWISVDNETIVTQTLTTSLSVADENLEYGLGHLGGVTGYLDDTAFWNRKLTQDEINTLYTGDMATVLLQ